MNAPLPPPGRARSHAAEEAPEDKAAEDEAARGARVRARARRFRNGARKVRKDQLTRRYLIHTPCRLGTADADARDPETSGI